MKMRAPLNLIAYEKPGSRKAICVLFKGETFDAVEQRQDRQGHMWARMPFKVERFGGWVRKDFLEEVRE